MWAPRTFLLSFAICFAAGEVHAAGVRIINSSAKHYHIWLWIRDQDGWSRPPLQLRSRDYAFINLAYPGKYYVVARDSMDRDFHVGWYDFHELAATKDNASLYLRELTEQRTGTRDVLEYVTEQRTRTVNGKEVVYTVRVPVQRTVEYTYTVDVPVLQWRRGDGFETVPQSRPSDD